MSSADAKKLVRQTFDGAAEMLQQEDFGELRKRVTSPTGTTAAGLQALYDNDFKRIVGDCVTSAANRSRELGKEFE